MPDFECQTCGTTFLFLKRPWTNTRAGRRNFVAITCRKVVVEQCAAQEENSPTEIRTARRELDTRRRAG